jgi:hypothetical protein
MVSSAAVERAGTAIAPMKCCLRNCLMNSQAPNAFAQVMLARQRAGATRPKPRGWHGSRLLPDRFAGRHVTMVAGGMESMTNAP